MIAVERETTEGGPRPPPTPEVPHERLVVATPKMMRMSQRLTTKQ